MTVNWKDAQLGTILTTDPAVALWTYIKNNWSQSTGYTVPAVVDIKFDTKFGLHTGFMNYVIVENINTSENDQILGRGRMRITDNKRIQIWCQGSSAKNTKWNIENHIRSIINANPTAMQATYGIDLIRITSFQEIYTEPVDDDSRNDRAPATKGQWISRSRALCTMIYDLYSS